MEPVQGRREAREWAVQFLFQRDFNRNDLEEALTEFWREKKPGERFKRFSEELIRGVLEHREDLDRRLNEFAEHWEVKRMGAVDRNVMRLALYEMLYRDDVPPVVSINEAVEIAKAYSGMESGRFVNGILDKACQGLSRPKRDATDKKR